MKYLSIIIFLFSVMTATSWAADAPSGYTKCAKDPAICAFTGTRQIAYGADGKFVYKTYNTSIKCTLANFGGVDPNPAKTVKYCSYARVVASSSIASSSSRPASSNASSSSRSTSSSSTSKASSQVSSSSAASSGALTDWKSGVATFYGATGGGNCSFDPTPNDLNVAAIGEIEYAGSATCGASAEVKGPLGTVIVRIVDRCPECQTGHLDLSQQAFAKIGNPSAGIIPITWRLVPTNVVGPVQYRFKEGSSQWWTAIQVRNHRLPIAKLEVRTVGTSVWVELPRQNYNYFLAASGVGPNAFDVRITSSTGAVLIDRLNAVIANATVAGAAQF